MIRALAAVVLVACGCGDDSRPPAVSEDGAAARQPRRSAAKDRDLRVLFAQLAVAKGCSALRERFVPLVSDADEQIGTIRVDRCHASVDGVTVSLRGRGRGWRWVSREKSKAGGEFALRSHVRFAAELSLDGDIDVAYAPGKRILTVWLSPKSWDISVEPIGEPDVDAEGTWSAVVGTVGSIIAESPEEEGAEAVKSKGRAALEAKIKSGITATASLCAGDVDVGFGHREAGQMISPPVPKSKLVDRVKMFPGGLILSGADPIRDGTRLAVEVSSGKLEAAVVCEAAASKLAEAYLAGETAEIETVASQIATGKVELTIKSPPCKNGVVMFRAVEGASTPATARYAVIPVGRKYEPIIDCSELESDDK